MTSCVILHNPCSGRGRAERWALRLIRHLASSKAVLPSDPPKRPRVLAVGTVFAPPTQLSQPPTFWVCCGGDGSLHHLRRFLPPEAIVLPAPCGSSNLWAAEMGLTSWRAVRQALDTGRVVRYPMAQLCLGEATYPVVHQMSFGFDAAWVQALDAHRRQSPVTAPWRRWASVTRQALQTWQPRPCAVSLNGQALGTFEAGVVSIGRYYAHPTLTLPPGTPMGWHLRLWRHWSPGRWAHAAWQGWRGQWSPEGLGTPSLQLPWTQGSLVMASTQAPQPWQADGEWLGERGRAVVTLSEHVSGTLRSK